VYTVIYPVVLSFHSSWSRSFVCKSFQEYDKQNKFS